MEISLRCVIGILISLYFESSNGRNWAEINEKKNGNMREKKRF